MIPASGIMLSQKTPLCVGASGLAKAVFLSLGWCNSDPSRGQGEDTSVRHGGH